MYKSLPVLPASQRSSGITVSWLRLSYAENQLEPIGLVLRHMLSALGSMWDLVLEPALGRGPVPLPVACLNGAFSPTVCTGLSLKQCSEGVLVFVYTVC